MRLRTAILALLVPASIAGIVLASPGCTAGYLARQGWHQAELLLGRQPIDRAIEDGHFTPEQIERLELIAQIKDYGGSIGLSATDNYETIHPTWDRTIWNVSACEPLAFEPVTWWFPVVGTVPYLGFFREQDARQRADRLERQGYDVYVRTAGAYSTLGWFRDPVLPQMLSWSEFRLADTLLHELAHATVWIPGSVQFNESFANFVGQEAALRYLEHTYGDGDELRAAHQNLEDRAAYREMLHELYNDLDQVYRDPDLSQEAKLEQRSALLDSRVERVKALDLHQPERFIRAVRRGTWNNARLMQFRTYNRSHDWFAMLLEQEDDDLLGFMYRVQDIAGGARDPYGALATAVGVDPEAADP